MPVLRVIVGEGVTAAAFFCYFFAAAGKKVREILALLCDKKPF
jgi:hypothetical protein